LGTVLEDPILDMAARAILGARRNRVLGTVLEDPILDMAARAIQRALVRECSRAGKAWIRPSDCG
jgi:hypothetical protein